MRFITVASVLALFAAVGYADTLTVAATSDIYGAGHGTLPANVFPGTFPPGANVPAGSAILTFSSVTGMVGCNFVITNGPDGTCYPFNTTVTGDRGLSGINVGNNQNMFLVGVFLNNNEPAGAGPGALTYDFGTPGNLSTSDATYAPAIDQVFFIGDGMTGTGTGTQQQFFVPGSASRLYLGFADSFDSVPSFYGDDVGSLTATFSFTSVPEPSAALPIAGALLVAFGRAWRKRKN